MPPTTRIVIDKLLWCAFHALVFHFVGEALPINFVFEQGFLDLPWWHKVGSSIHRITVAAPGTRSLTSVASMLLDHVHVVLIPRALVQIRHPVVPCRGERYSRWYRHERL